MGAGVKTKVTKQGIVQVQAPAQSGGPLEVLGNDMYTDVYSDGGGSDDLRRRSRAAHRLLAELAVADSARSARGLADDGDLQRFQGDTRAATIFAEYVSGRRDRARGVHVSGF